jgi:cytoplasmic iron level regulating protein YaaA (DUF328/UPF0246 family)
MQPSVPEFHDDALVLSQIARRLGADGLRKLMRISPALGELNHNRFNDFDQDAGTKAARPAALAFAGDTYVGLDAASLDKDEWRHAQSHLRILSGLYGLLRPLDLLQAYRLEMGSKLRTPVGASLYEYWGDRIARRLNDLAVETGSHLLINCASAEYFKAVDPDVLKFPVVMPVFLEERDGATRILSFWAKRARGAMARYVIQNRIKNPEDLQGFETGGYRYDPWRSTTERPVFVRPYPETVASESRLAS